MYGMPMGLNLSQQSQLLLLEEERRRKEEKRKQEEKRREDARKLQEQQAQRQQQQQQGGGLPMGGMSIARGFMGGGGVSGAAAPAAGGGSAGAGIGSGIASGVGGTAGSGAGASIGGGSAAGGGAGGGLAAAGPWAALAAIIMANEKGGMDANARNPNKTQHAGDVLTGRIVEQDFHKRWLPKMFGDDLGGGNYENDSTGFGADTHALADFTTFDPKNAWKTIWNNGSARKVFDKIF